MRAPTEAARLRIYFGSDETHAGQTLEEAIVLLAQARRLASVTVLRGVRGYGPADHTHTIALALSANVPVVVEIVDDRAAIDAFLPGLAPLLRDGMVTLEPVTVLRYGPVAMEPPPRGRPADR
jgi:uncharacterized protein